MRKQLSYANVMSTLAVVLALGGGTTAIAVSSKVGAKNLKPIAQRTATDANPDDPEQDFARAKCLKGEKLTGGSTTSNLSGGPDGNSWVAAGHGATSATALCLKK